MPEVKVENEKKEAENCRSLVCFISY